MAALRSVCGHYIFALWFLLLSSFLLFSSPNLSRRTRILDVCHTSPHVVALVETCCTRLAENTGRKKRQKFAFWAPSHYFVGLFFVTKAHIDNRKKLVKQQYLPHTSPQYGEL